MKTVYVVSAGNVIDDYIEVDSASDNVLEIFDNLRAAKLFGSLFDFFTIEIKELRTSGFPASVSLRFGLEYGNVDKALPESPTTHQ